MGGGKWATGRKGRRRRNEWRTGPLTITTKSGPRGVQSRTRVRDLLRSKELGHRGGKEVDVLLRTIVWIECP